ncbi:uncharacterized protein K452DRAFT_276827 [Aplosporella prunicola CBS 121167]|uniref:Uncharacterized protein n=1 Tax=Aplosporella prunicola CBS 121167 TaxID=1176127 RepID=A0A6A6B5D9_9PEZI|nr:uncharacterized protein K452DRAFT_276827 [Aplosporella prunicola CBS 121167]KAF2138444.1 hypothetical protein K452DRAFT_276827 [Aplosporella prunicola CBS 121167]
MSTPSFSIPPPPTKLCSLSYPAPTVLLVTLNRPKQLNCINIAGHHELHDVFSWLDREPSLRVGIITGAGRAFCAGADLKEWNTSNEAALPRPMPPSGFGGLSRRSGLKPVIAAVNGPALGGGCEMLINSDMVLASAQATLALPEAKRGVVALAGALPRLVRTVGRQRAMEMALTGRDVGAVEARDWGLVNRVVDGGAGEVVREAVQLATAVAANSPDAVVVSREGVKMGWDGLGVEDATRLWAESWYPRLLGGENMKEGVRAFVEKRMPVWKAAKL